MTSSIPPRKLVYPKVELNLWESRGSKKLPILVPQTPPGGETTGQFQLLQPEDCGAHESSGCESATQHLANDLSAQNAKNLGWRLSSSSIKNTTE